MHRRLWVAGGALLAVCGLALSAGGAYAYYFDSTLTDVIAAVSDGLKIMQANQTQKKTFQQYTVDPSLETPTTLLTQ